MLPKIRCGAKNLHLWVRPYSDCVGKKKKKKCGELAAIGTARVSGKKGGFSGLCLVNGCNLISVASSYISSRCMKDCGLVDC